MGSELGSASPQHSTIPEDGDTLGPMSMMRRNDSIMSISGMLPRTGSELQISEMLDLFDQQGGTPRQAPTPTDSLPPAQPLPSAAPQPAPSPSNLTALQEAAAPPPDAPPPPISDANAPMRVPIS